MKVKKILFAGLLCILAAAVLFAVWQIKVFRTSTYQMMDADGYVQVSFEYEEGANGQKHIQMEGEKEGLQRAHILYSDEVVSELECYADLTRGDLLVNGLSAVPGLMSILPEESGVFFTLDQIETILGEELIDKQTRSLLTEEKLRTLAGQIMVLPCPRFLLPESIRQSSGNGKGYVIPGSGTYFVLGSSEKKDALTVKFSVSRNDISADGEIEVLPDSRVRIDLPDPVSDKVFGLIRTGLDYLSGTEDPPSE